MKILLKTGNEIYMQDFDRSKLPVLCEKDKDDVDIYNIYEIDNRYYSIGIIDRKKEYAIASKLNGYSTGEETKYTNNITCPFCGYVDFDSFEHGENGIINCGKCNSEFEFYSEVTVDYFTRPIKRNEPKEDQT